MHLKVVAVRIETSVQYLPEALKDRCKKTIRDALSVLHGPDSAPPSDAAVNRLLKRAQLGFCLSRIPAVQQENMSHDHVLKKGSDVVTRSQIESS